jgi:hypothetical protein
MILLSNAVNGTVGVEFADATAGNNWKQPRRTFYLSGVLGSGGTVKLQLSPDTMIGGGSGKGVAEASSRWFTAFTFNAASATYVTITDNFRKCRAVVTAGDGTTSITLEGV